MRKPIIAGNWKMNKTMAETRDFVASLKGLELNKEIEAVICAPFTDLQELSSSLQGTGVAVGAQNFHYEDQGAFTGEISAAMLKEIGVSHVIIGHSERRQYFAETDETVNKKLHKALAVGLVPMVCVGESLAEREEGKTKDLIKEQVLAALKEIKKEEIEKIVIAYEPIWAIGTGKTASKEEANEVCAFIRQTVAGLYSKEEADKLRIQYGGSVNASNIKDLMSESDIDGALVGGASLKAEDYAALVNYR